MIQMPNEADIKNHRELQKSRILSNYKTDHIVKGMSVEDFGEKYGNPNYRFYKESAVEQFKTDFLKSEGSTQEALDAVIEKLEKVDVSMEKGEIVSFFIEKVEEEKAD
jgi:hypothetical protein